MNEESYFELDRNEQLEVLQFYSNKLSMRDTILKKDIWLCWVLDVIFNMPNIHPMAFKGGTSLSKVFGAIDRFSEDVDITLDYRFFDISRSFDPKMSKSKAKSFSEQLKKKVKDYRDTTIVPALEFALKDLILPEPCSINVDDSGEKIWLNYPSVLSGSEQYIKESVLIELGGRNVIDPNEIHIVKPYIAEDNSGIKFSEPKITVLSPQRTFWEKATLIHVECHRGVRQNADRLSRHWYDLVKLYEQNIGQLAMDNYQLLEDVVNLKTIFFNTNYANYSDCLNHKFKLLPENEDLDELRKDYIKMNNAGMIYDSNKFNFEYIIEKIREITEKLNK